MALTDAAILSIKDMIVRGELAPGQRLPKEADLAVRLGLSRNSLREAVRALALVNVLDVRQGDGTFVTSLQPDLLLEVMGFVIDLHADSSVLDFLEVRRVLEPAATALAAVRIDAAGIKELRKVVDEVSSADTVERLLDNDVRFHGLVASASGNVVLCSVIESLSRPTMRARTWRGLTETNALDRTLQEHREIYQGIADRDPEVARSWATVHIAGVEQWLRQALDAT